MAGCFFLPAPCPPLQVVSNNVCLLLEVSCTLSESVLQAQSCLLLPFAPPPPPHSDSSTLFDSSSGCTSTSALPLASALWLHLELPLRLGTQAERTPIESG